MMHFNPLRFVALLAAVALVVGMTSPAPAQPIAAPGTEGLPVIVSNADPVVATFQGHTAAYSNDLYLELDAAGLPGLDGDSSNDLFIFNNQSTPVGTTADLGPFNPGVELVFRLHVNNTGYDYYSGGAVRNPDGVSHARVQANWLPETTLLSFEDLYNGPFDYNDTSFSFSNTTVPEPATGLLALTCLLGAGAGSRLDFRLQRFRATTHAACKKQIA